MNPPICSVTMHPKVPCLDFAVFVQPLPLIFRRGPRILDLDRACAWRCTQLMGSKREGVMSAVAANLDPMIPGSGNRAKRRAAKLAERRALAPYIAAARRRYASLGSYYEDCDRRGVSTGD